MCYHSGSEWTWERWQWRSIPHSPKLQHYWSLTIRLFNVISRILVVGSNPSAEMQSVYSAVPADWANRWWGRGITPLQRCSRCILQSQPTEQLNEKVIKFKSLTSVEEKANFLFLYWVTWLVNKCKEIFARSINISLSPGRLSLLIFWSSFILFFVILIHAWKRFFFFLS